MHIGGSRRYLPVIRRLFQSFANLDPPTSRYKAVTPKLLKAIFRMYRDQPDSMFAHTADLLCGAFFFAMRGCEYVRTPVPGRTRRIILANVVFRDEHRRVIPHSHPELISRAYVVSITFIAQKNGKKMDSRSQLRSGHHFLCPVLRWVSIVQRITRLIPYHKPSTTVDSFPTASNALTHITSTFTRQLLWHVCAVSGGFPVFGFHPHELGNPSIRSGAAMSLFLMNHSPARIMILGRWSSDAFLVYIRPQVMEWAHNMSHDMVRFDSFTDIPHSTDFRPNDDSALRAREQHPSGNGRSSSLTLPRFALHH